MQAYPQFFVQLLHDRHRLPSYKDLATAMGIRPATISAWRAKPGFIAWAAGELRHQLNREFLTEVILGRVAHQAIDGSLEHQQLR